MRFRALSIVVIAGLALGGAVAVCSPASATTAPSSYVLPVTYRDFLYDGTTIPGPGHPDFQSFNNGLQTGLVQSTLGSDHEPVWLSNQQSLSGAVNFCWWFHDTNCAGAGTQNPYAADVPTDQLGNPTTLTLNQISPSVYQYNNTTYYPIDGLGWNSPAYGVPQTSADCNSANVHNFAFTQEIHTSFAYSSSSAPTLNVAASHDVWIFINGKLVIDLGGVHGTASGSITLDAPHAAQLGLVDTAVYPIDIFTAQRHTCSSTFQLTSTFALGQPPQVAVNGVTEGAHYPKGQVPAASCTVTSSLDGTPDVSPVLSTPSNGDGTGSQTATCSYTDRAGETSSASVTYTIEASAAQTILFTSTPPIHVVTGTPYTVTATGGFSGNPVVFITDPTSAGCEVAANGTVTFYAAGLCKIDAGQAAGGGFNAAKTVQQRIRVALIKQTVTITSTPPTPVMVGTPYTVTATGGPSGNQIVFSVASTSAGVCAVAGDGTVTFTATGRCVLVATQAGTAVYAKGVARQLVTVTRS